MKTAREFLDGCSYRSGGFWTISEADIEYRDAEWQARLDALTAEVGEWAERAALAERRGYERGLRAALEVADEKRALCRGERVPIAICDEIEALIGKPEGT